MPMSMSVCRSHWKQKRDDSLFLFVSLFLQTPCIAVIFEILMYIVEERNLWTVGRLGLEGLDR